MLITVKDTSFKIRNCKDEDYRFVYNLFKKNMYALFVKNWGGWKRGVFRRDFRRENIKIVNFKNRRIAFYDLEFKDKFSYIRNIQVSSSMQGNGLGTALLNLIETETREKGLKRIRLRVFKDNPARKLYLKLKYKQIKDEGSTVILEKKI